MKILDYYLIDNYEQYLINNFDDYNDFYAVNIKFWNLLMDENEEAPEYINNSDIAEYSNLVKEEDLLHEKIDLLERELTNKQEKVKIKKSFNENEKNDKKQDKNQKVKDQGEKNDDVNETQIVTQIANLKKGKKFRKDFIILCGELYKLIKNNYRFDYLIKFRKFRTSIHLKSKKNNNKKEEKKEEGKEEKMEEVKLNEKDEEDEEYIKKEKLINEKLNKFVIDIDKGLISKIREGNGGCYLLDEIDFFPVKVYLQSFGNIVRIIERAKVMYKNLNEAITILKLPKKDQDLIRAEKKKKRDLLDKKKQKYKDLMDNLNYKRMLREIDEKEYDIKISQIQEMYKDILDNPEKSGNYYATDITFQEFLDTLKKYKNTILLEKQNDIIFYQRHKTFKEISDEILRLNPGLKNKKIDIYYYFFNSEALFKPDENYEFEKEENDREDFIGIFVDIYNDKGENFIHLLSEKEKERKINKEESEKQKDKTKKEKDKAIKVNEEKNNKEKSENKNKLSKEEIEKLKGIEKEKVYEDERPKKDQEKEMILEEEERKRQEKEEKERLNKIQKQQEFEREKKNEREKFISPPYSINNYGNTSYFNSINQIFFNLPILQQIFLNPKICYYVNKSNNFGRQGKFFEIYKEFYWIKPSKIGDTTIDLKKMVGKFKEDFNNTAQQDANEYLYFVLENLHEELNLHSYKNYIENKDDIFHHNTYEELGNIYWANNLKRNTSFIDSIFMFQLQTNLMCKFCRNNKVNFETNYIFELPLSLCRMTTVEIYLYRLPFIYKLYYDKINKDFESYIKKEENKSANIFQNLWKYYSYVLSNEQKKKHLIKLHFSLKLDREKKMADITKILRGIKPLDLEPENITKEFSEENYDVYKIKHLTELIICSKEKDRIIYPDSNIDKYVNIEDKIIINAYEVLNTNGMKLLFNKENSKDEVIMNLYTYLLKTKIINNNRNDLRKILYKSKFFSRNSFKNNFNAIDNKEKNDIITEKKIIEHKKETNIMSLKERMIYYQKELINSYSEMNLHIIIEFEIPIFHYYSSTKQPKYLFRDFIHEKIIYESSKYRNK